MSIKSQRLWFQSSRAMYLGIAAFVVFVAGFFWVELSLRKRTVPPSTVTDIISFLKWHPNTKDFLLFERGQEEHLIVRGEYGGLLPSETSGYAFDRNGRLVDWSSDTGDDSDFQGKWLQGGSPRPLSQEEALSWLKDHEGP